jgi:hypothetical protein
MGRVRVKSCDIRGSILSNEALVEDEFLCLKSEGQIRLAMKQRPTSKVLPVIHWALLALSLSSTSWQSVDNVTVNLTWQTNDGT